jgi:CubicO group peptidase (beta-lactamase class C family)
LLRLLRKILEGEMFQDLRYGARMLWKRPGFTLIAVLALAFGASAMASLGMGPVVIGRAISRSQDKSSSPGQQPIDYSSIIAKVKEQIPPLLKQNSIPGLAIALVDGEKLVWAEGFGYTDLSNTERVSADTLFSLQSISKTYTATGFMLAVDKGWLKLDEPLRKYLPKFTVKSRFGAGEADRITFRHLLSHWSGLTHEAPCGNNFDESPCPFADHIRSISETWLMFPVGERYSYSNLGIDLAGYALELRARKPFAQFMQDELFKPLGMTSSTFILKEALSHPSFAKGHTKDLAHPVAPIPMVPAGSMYSTVKDMARFISFHLAGGKVNGKQVIRAESLKAMYTPQYAIAGQLGGYGLGVTSQPWAGGTLLNHNGGGYGYSTSQIWMPEYQLGVVVLTNSAQGGSAASGLAYEALGAMIKAKYSPLPEIPLLRIIDRPIITLEAERLRRLQGNYKHRGGLAVFTLEEGSLYYISGREKLKLNPHSPTEFSASNRKFTFELDKLGRPKGVQLFALYGVEYWPVSERPDDEAGPNNREWQEYLGDYTSKSFGNIIKVVIERGYLYLSGWQGGLRLTDYRPGLFFTADGEAVMFQNGRMSLGYRPFQKKPTSESRNINR